MIRASSLDPKKITSPIDVIMLEIFLNTVTIGTVLCCNAAIPVNNIPQKKILTGAHCLAMFRSNGGYSTNFNFLHISTLIIATMA